MDGKPPSVVLQKTRRVQVVKFSRGWVIHYLTVPHLWTLQPAARQVMCQHAQRSEGKSAANMRCTRHTFDARRLSYKYISGRGWLHLPPMFVDTSRNEALYRSWKSVVV